MTKSIKNMLLAGVALGLTVAVADAQQTRTVEPRAPTTEDAGDALFVTPSVAARAFVDGALLLDTRPLPAFLLGHPAGAVRIAWDDFSDPDSRGRLSSDSDELARLLGELGVDGTGEVYVVGGWDAFWGEEARIVWMLRRIGVADAYIVEGGWPAWTDAGLEISRGPASATARTFTPGPPDSSVEATLADLPSADLVLDVRTQREYDGATPHGSSRGGHVPGAVHLEWTDLLDEQGRLLPADRVREVVGAPLDADVVAYCTGGVRSAFVWAALRRAGYEHASNYAGSWWEYAASNAPMER